MNTVPKGIAQTKTKPKTAAKNAKKRSSGEPKKYKMLPVAKVEELAVAAAAKALRSKTLSVSSKALKLEMTVELLIKARERNLSKAGEWALIHMNDPVGTYDKRAVLR